MPSRSLCFLFATVLSFVPHVHAEPPAAAPLVASFATEPSDSLIRRLEVEPDAALAQSGLVVTTPCQAIPEAHSVLVETTLTNPGQEPITLNETTPARWTFRLRDAQDTGYEKLTYSSDVWYGSSYWTGPDWTRVGKDWHHPGQNTPAVRRFTVPSDGRLTISGRIYKAHVDPATDGVRLAILHGERTVWQAEIDGGDNKGVEPNLALDVRTGDVLRFVVHKRGEIACDTTHWDPILTYADGKRYQASESFSTTIQGLGGWSYEMPNAGVAAPRGPRAYALTEELALREIPLNAGQTVTLESGRDLPLLLVSDGMDRSGVVTTFSGTGPWTCRLERSADEQLKLSWSGPGATVAPGQTLVLPRVMLSAYQGEWLSGLLAIPRLLQASQFTQLQQTVDAALSRRAAPGKPTPELDLWLLVQAEWQSEDKLQESAESYAAAIARHLPKAERLLTELQSRGEPGFLKAEATQLCELAQQTKTAPATLEAQRSLYQSVRVLKRQLALANPLLDFSQLFFCKRAPASYSHLVMQYYGWRARPGGGLFVLDRPGYSLNCRDVLGDQLGTGSVLEPRLSYDARRVVFSFVPCTGKEREPATVTNDLNEGFYHIYSMNVDGGELKQLTDGNFDDLMPTWLPDGGIAFSSTRRGGYARCFGPQFSPRWDVYTLHRMEADGSKLRTLSFHDTNEWFPTVSQTGHLLYARWDYIDRDAVTHQTLWATRPDGTSPMAVWGNGTPNPHCTFQLQPIPNSAKVIFTASAHHSITGGSIVIVDPAVRNNGQEALTRITPEIPFPESETLDIKEYYDAPWPLSEDFYLVSYSPKPLIWEPGANAPNALGIYLLDRFGNREVVYRDPQIGSTNACPLTPRPTPPVLPSTLPEHAPPVGEMVLADVYQGLGDCPRGSIKQLRIVQIFPKTTPLANTPPIGLALEENARAILGTVPVEADGSARFLVPAQKPILFQALDEDGVAYQTMRTITYVQPGEKITCVGCHENRMSAPVPTRDLLALQRPASKIEPGDWGGQPFSFVRVVQPVLDQHCVRCHGGEKTEAKLDLTGTPHQGFSRAYWSLCGDRSFWGPATNPQNAAEALVPRFGGRNQIQATPPGGQYGARGSRLMALLRAEHAGVHLQPEELQRVATWIDMNATFYGAYSPEDQARQFQGQDLPMPDLQ